MIDITGVRHIQERIAQLQEQFGMPGNVPGMEFSKTLDKAIQKAGGTDKTQVVPAAGNASKTGQAQSAKSALPAYSVNASLPLADQSLSGLIGEASKKYKVDPKLLSAIAEVESGGNQNETSSAGAVGVMQLMPDTAASLGVNPYDKQQNVEGGAKYLRQMLDTFGGDVTKAVAAYNAGPQAVKDYGGIPPYKETQNYVNKVLDIYR
ncbi:MAG: lytic transglycosylase domain-containing protein [Selenomonas sp.]|jgi:soluble lytic murein transglycosylase-like protein|nr:lytic transglycosylase domain-containing protein [Selenomonas sp.]